MNLCPDRVHDLLRGPLLAKVGSWPLVFQAVLGNLRPRFIPKGRAGSGYRAVSRNGRVLLASNLPIEKLADGPARVRLQTWHRAFLPGDAPEPYGIVLWVRAQPLSAGEPVYVARLVSHSEEPSDLELDVGGGMRLEFLGEQRAANRER